MRFQLAIETDSAHDVAVIADLAKLYVDNSYFDPEHISFFLDTLESVVKKQSFGDEEAKDWRDIAASCRSIAKLINEELGTDEQE